ncbi:type II toxin-antitoxin system RelE/ParE family toxin [Nitratifractor sp.]
MLDIAVHKTFSKDLKKAQLNPTNTAKLFAYIAMLLEGSELPPQANDHALSGEYRDTREFHISGDLLIVYRIEGNVLQLLRIGTHAQLFR